MQLPVTIPPCDTIANASEVDEKEINKLILKGAPGFALYMINSTRDKPKKNTDTPNPSSVNMDTSPTSIKIEAVQTQRSIVPQPVPGKSVPEFTIVKPIDRPLSYEQEFRRKQLQVYGQC